MRVLPIVAALPLIACSATDNQQPGIAGSGGGSARSYAVADFTAVELAGADDVEVRVGDGFSVRAEGDPDVLDQLRITKDGAALEIGRRNRSGFDWRGRKARIVVTMPRIVAGEVAGSGNLTIDRVTGGDFAADLAGSGAVQVGTMAAGRVEVEIAGSGSFRAAGTARQVDIDIAGSGSVAAGGLRADGAEVSIAGSGDVALAVDGAAKVSVMGSGDVDLGPAARCTVSRMGSGNVRCGGR